LFIGLCLVVAVITTVARTVFDVPYIGWIGVAATFLYVALCSPSLTRTVKIVLTCAAVASFVSVFWIDDLATAFKRAANVSCFFAAVFTAGAFLRQASEKSPMIQRSGLHLIAEPQARRYAALSIGANILGVIMSFGSPHLLGSMIRGGKMGQANDAERKSLIAIHRGFALSAGWSPISIPLAMGLSLSPGASTSTVLTVAFVTIVGLMVLGWVMARGTSASVASEKPNNGWSVQLGLLGLVATIFIIIFGVVETMDIRLIEVVVMVLPMLALAWIAIQSRGGSVLLSTTRFRRNIHDLLSISFPSFRMEVTILASAGLAGNLVAAALPTEQIAAWISALSLPSAVIPALVVWLVVLGGQVAMNPIVTVTIVGAILPAPLLLGADPSLVAASYMLAWSACVANSPYSLTTLITAGIGGVEGREVAYKWSGWFNIAVMVALSIWLTALSAWVLSG
jgi:hypothetical protein